MSYIPRNCFAIRLMEPGRMRLVHRPSGEVIQRHNSDFCRVSDAAKVRDMMISAAPEWDWSDPSFMEDMPVETFRSVWAAIYREDA